MATNQAAFVTQLRAERASIIAQIAAIDVPEEEARLAAATAALAPHLATFQAAEARYSVISDKVERLAFLNQQFADLGVAP